MLIPESQVDAEDADGWVEASGSLGPHSIIATLTCVHNFTFFVQSLFLFFWLLILVEKKPACCTFIFLL